MKIYTERERDQYEPPPCPGCGHAVDQGWLDATLSDDLPRRKYTPGRWACHTPGCRYNPASGRTVAEAYRDKMAKEAGA